MTAELAVDRGIIDQPATLGLIPSEVSELAPVTELFPQIDPLQLTREEFLSLPDGNSRRDVLIGLRRDPYNSLQAEQARRLFPEGFGIPLSDIEKRVFASMGRVMVAEDGIIADRDMDVLIEHLHGVSIDQAVTALQEEGANRRAGHFWATRQEIGGYDLNREIAFEIERQAEIENLRDEMRLHSLQDEARQLSGRDLMLRDADIEEMERLGDEYEARQKSKEAHWQAEREKGYQLLRVQ